MRNYHNPNIFKKEGLKPHQILVTYTSPPDWEMYKEMLITDVEGLEYNEYLVLRGSHCSCFDFDEVEWHGEIYTKDELIKLAYADYNSGVFWKEVLIQLGELR